MRDGVDGLLAQQTFHRFTVADVPMYEPVLRTLLCRVQVREIAGIGQRIEYDDPITGMLAQPVENEVRADEARAARDEQSRHGQALQGRPVAACASAPGRSRAPPASACRARCSGAGGPRSDTPLWRWGSRGSWKGADPGGRRSLRSRRGSRSAWR